MIHKYFLDFLVLGYFNTGYSFMIHKYFLDTETVLGYFNIHSL